MKNTHLTNEWAIWAGLAIFAVALVVILFLVNFDVYFLMVTPLLVIISFPVWALSILEMIQQLTGKNICSTMTIFAMILPEPFPVLRIIIQECEN